MIKTFYMGDNMLFKKNKALGYARVSVESENIDNQILEIEKFAEAQGLELVEIFKDIGVSGSRPALEREGFKKLLEASRLLNVKTIIVYDLTRLGRDLFDLVNTYKALLEQGFDVLFIKHPELNARPGSAVSEALRKALLTMLGIVSELERAFIVERTRAGLERAKREGIRLGRRPVEIPMDKVQDLLRKGLSKKDVYRLLIDMGYLRYKEKGVERILSYDRFLKRLKSQSST
ncbi:MAG: recombinase family protein [Nanopusillaceae archaeon]